ncbi:restriction endonuclease subunit S [Shewanella algae]|uniref:Type I restriction enzyme EcoKI specificity protein n=2 Tax=Bacteria TaxID=2 RepID=A0A380BMB2_9GAMM|nr:restriction endonuclease subunit S [Shewanella algae]MBO2608074.1 restriction endonuclease subunit S [Shewanella algae]SUJ03180.1 Type I restriction enzyme EcoKI specificity protein [Shewanella algae]
MSQYKAYPAYKDSGVEWIGQVPEHWEVKPICRVTSVNDDALSDSTTGSTRISYVDISSVGYTEGIKQATEMAFEDAPSRARRKASTGDVVVSTVRTYLKAVAAVTDEYADCIFSTGFAVLRARQLEQSFLKWMILNELLVQAIEAHSEGLSYPAINASALVKLKSVIPPPEEQATIAAALDCETARIDALIGKKTRFIELLKEKRQALITHAVTKGLDPNVKMKDSGVEWIGQVPEHWEVKPFKYILSAPMSYGANESAESDDPNHPRYIRITDLTENGTLREDTFKTLPWDKAYSYLLSDGDILLARSGATVGKSFLYRETNGAACFAGYLIKASCDEEKALPKYIYAYLQSHSYWEYISGSNIQSTIQNVSAEKYSSMVLPVPQREEQATIAATLDRETARIDALIGKAEQSITLLKERRSAFITAAVTGQIDLRGEQ